MTLPSFLIIGAMKAGTTTLYEDLLSVPGLWLPPQKEPEDLIHADVESPEGRARYTRKYDQCPENAKAGDASTAYAKRPTFNGVAERAKKVLGKDLRIIYLTRSPIKRIISQYHHLWGLEIETRPLNEAVTSDDTYPSYSRYDWQLEPWRDAFPASSILVIRFEDYLEDRTATLTNICDFLEVDVPDICADGTHRNKSDGKRVVRPGSVMSKFAESRLYLFTIKPLIPTGLRDRIKSAILPKARRMTDTLAGDVEEKLKQSLMTDPIAARYFEQDEVR